MFGLLKPDKQKVGDRLRQVKDQLGLSFTDFGERLGLIKPTINSYVRGYSLAPIHVIEKVSKLSGKSVGWFYFGEIEDYIHDYLMVRGEDNILKDYPELPQTIKHEFLTGSFKNPGWENEVGYPDEAFIDDCFAEFHYDAMKEYVSTLVKNYLEHPEISSDLTEKEKVEQAVIITSEVNSYISMSGDVAYGDKATIQKLIEQSYQQLEHTSFNDTYLIGKLINVLDDDKETEALIQFLSMHLTGKNFSHSLSGVELIEFFQSMRPKLIELYAQTDEEIYIDWFEKE